MTWITLVTTINTTNNKADHSLLSTTIKSASCSDLIRVIIIVLYCKTFLLSDNG